MELLKSRLETVYRDNLFFNKFRFRVELKADNLHWVKRCKDVEQAKKKLFDTIQHSKRQFSRPWFNAPTPLEDTDFDLLGCILAFNQKYKNSKDVTFRFESDTMGVYTSDWAIVEEVLNISEIQFPVVEVIPAPAGTMWFAKKPPAKFRTYLTNKKMSISFADEMNDYLERTPAIRPSTTLRRYLYHWNPNSPPNRSIFKITRHIPSAVYLSSSYYLDYNDEASLLMMHLVFGEAIGKTFKLEKRQC
jgi:hypothetical protein